MIVHRAPGKLFIAGEYAVVESGEPAVLVAVDRYLTVELTDAAGGHGTVRSGRSELRWRFDGDRVAVTAGRNEYLRSAIQAVEDLRAARGLPRRLFDLRIGTELADSDGRKLGLGSSAALTAGVVAVLDQFHGLGLDAQERFRLALLGTIEVSPKASGGDLAASTLGGWVHYTSPDREALAARRAADGVAAALGSEAWGGCTLTPMPAPHQVQLLVGWTGSPASTPGLVGSVRRAPRADPAHADFLAGSRDIVTRLTEAILHGGRDALPPIRDARRLLQRLASETGVEIETEALRLLCDVAERHGAAAKPSGAGGGDCGVALADAALPGVAILQEWVSHGIKPLEVSVTRGNTE